MDLYDVDGRFADRNSGVRIVEMALVPTSGSAIAIPVSALHAGSNSSAANHATVFGNTTAPDDSNLTCHGSRSILDHSTNDVDT